MTLRVAVCELGAGAERAGLLAEYDAEDDAIRVSARAFARIRAALGEHEARRFIACAVAHERYHRSVPGGSERAAHTAGQAACGVDPRRYEAVLRGSRS